MENSDIPGPLIIQSDYSLLLEVHHPSFGEARDDINPFSELEKSPEHIHTYKISPLSLWNAASSGITGEAIIDRLKKWSRYKVPENIHFTVFDIISRFGKITLKPDSGENKLKLMVDDAKIRIELLNQKKISKYITPVDDHFIIDLLDRGTIKQELLEIGYPVEDLIPLKPGNPLSIRIPEKTRDGEVFQIRDYQIDAAKTFHGNGNPGSGYGTIVLPCGAGKTIVGIQVMSLLQTNTLILTTNIAAVHQWIEELLDKTELTADEIGEYTGERKEIKPVTIATYQIVTWRPDKNSPFPHFSIFHKNNWGLIIYDEVHLLPAPVFRVTAEIQAVHRLGLTATLVREDGQEGNVFSLVGPKRYDIPWKDLESKGWIAEAKCIEIRVELPEKERLSYITAGKRQKFRIASENPWKIPIIKQLIENHPEDAIIVIGQYIDQLNSIAEELDVPLITGKTPNAKREEIYAAFRKGEENIIVVSKVANFAIDLPDASMAIQVSGSFGSRQEEAQRLGRILRPKKRNATFYTLVSQYSEEEEFSANRQKFLTEQGYKYHIEVWEGEVFPT